MAWLAATGAWAATPLQLRPGLPVVVDPAEPAAVFRAADDLRRDLQWVLGSPSPQQQRLPTDATTPAIVVTCKGPGTAAWRDSALTGSEAHAVFVRGEQVILQGTDPRGTIYAIYSFSDEWHCRPWCGVVRSGLDWN